MLSSAPCAAYLGRGQEPFSEYAITGGEAPWPKKVPDPNLLLAFPRSAFTLVELLITILILAILGTALLGASRVAMEGARASRTKSTIAKLNTLMMERYESYQTRRVDFNASIQSSINAMPTTNPQQRRAKGKAVAVARLKALRELMKLEMPDRWSDVLLAPVPDNNPLGKINRAFNPTPPAFSPSFLQNRPALSNAYLRRLKSAATIKNDGIILRQHQGAECFYMFIMLATGDGEARELFSQQDIGDVDGDGAPEFLDGCKQPIEFLRWPAGFVSDLQSVVVIDDTTTPKKRAGNPDVDHDPFDPFRVDSRAYRLVPLIYSAGPDGDLDIEVAPGNTVGLNPYAQLTDSSGKLLNLLGTQRDNDGDGDNSLDNIHNHLMNNK